MASAAVKRLPATLEHLQLIPLHVYLNELRPAEALLLEDRIQGFHLAFHRPGRSAGLGYQHRRASRSNVIVVEVHALPILRSEQRNPVINGRTIPALHLLQGLALGLLGLEHQKCGLREDLSRHFRPFPLVSSDIHHTRRAKAQLPHIPQAPLHRGDFKAAVDFFLRRFFQASRQPSSYDVSQIHFLFHLIRRLNGAGEPPAGFAQPTFCPSTKLPRKRILSCPI